MSIVRVVESAEGPRVVDCFSGRELPVGESEVIQGLLKANTQTPAKRARIEEVEKLLEDPMLQSSLAEAQAKGANFQRI